jgi:hypothetical protein
MQLDQNKLAAVATEAISKVQTSGKDVSRWINAIARAVIEIENNPFIHWQPENNSLLVWSQTSSKIYEANGICQCRAFEQGYPCYHRAAARLIQRYQEVIN